MLKIIFFSAKQYDEESFNLSFEKSKDSYKVKYLDFLLSEKTVKLAHGYDVVCGFVNDDFSRPVIESLAQNGVKLILMRCAGVDKVDLAAAKEFGLQVVNVPAYSPQAVAEHTVGLMMTLNRHFHKAYQRTRDANFNLDGLVGFNFSGKTVGVIGTGRIGYAVMQILKGFGMNIICSDPYINQAAVELGAEYVSLDELYARADIITLHCPMTKENHYLLNSDAMDKMKDGVMIINTSRGKLIDSNAAVKHLNSGKIGSLGLDVYEHEKDLFFQDNSNTLVVDDVFRILSASYNVIFTGHQAFLTKEALNNIAHISLKNLEDFFAEKESGNELVK